MYSGLRLLKNRLIKATETSELLPSSFLEFASLYELGEGSFQNEKLRKDGIDFDLPLTNVVFKNNEIDFSIEYLYDIGRIHSILEAGEKFDTPFTDRGLIRIAHCSSPTGANLYISVDKESDGKVFFGEEGNYIIIANDIFTFAGKLSSCINSYQLKDSTQLYRSWGEDFWRLK